MCCIYENTNFESNSQLLLKGTERPAGCVVSTKIQILKAIHNGVQSVALFPFVVLYLRKYKFWKQFTTVNEVFFERIELCCIYENTNFESNSQLSFDTDILWHSCVVSTKIQILKAIHNALAIVETKINVVLYLRKYKFWKQFTTSCGKS